MILVAGGPTQHEADRLVPAESLRPLQHLSGDGFLPVEGFSVIAGVGVSNLASIDEQIWWSDGSDLRVGASGQNVAIADLADVHELSVMDGQLVLANTGRDEVISIDPRRQLVTSRKRIADGVLHLNQIFVGVDGRRYGLVHHVHGRQLAKRVAGRMLKIQGDGGVIDIETGRPIALRLTAPHSARVVGDEVWIADSGRARIVRYDVAWREIGAFPTAGWGRGAVVEGANFWLGLSPLRRRYQGFVDGPGVVKPELHVFDVSTCQLLERFVIEGIDQINGVHDLPLDAAPDEVPGS